MKRPWSVNWYLSISWYLWLNSAWDSDVSITFFFYFYFFLNCSGFCHTLTWISHGFTCIPHPDPRSHLPLHPIPLVFPVHRVRALVSCIQPGVVICFTLDNIHVVMLFSRNIPPSPSPTESKSLFYTSVYSFLSVMEKVLWHRPEWQREWFCFLHSQQGVVALNLLSLVRPAVVVPSVDL